MMSWNEFQYVVLILYYTYTKAMSDVVQLGKNVTMLILSLLLLLVHTNLPSSANTGQSNLVATDSCHSVNCCDFRREG